MPSTDVGSGFLSRGAGPSRSPAEGSDWRPSSTLETLKVRAAMLRTTREFFADRGVMEVQTPALGAATVTDPAIDSMCTRMPGAPGRYLQTSPEYHMKRLLAAGAPSIYQIGPVFRDGERGRWHNPEFTMLEWYRLGFDAARLMDEVADLVDDLLGPAAYARRSHAELIGARFGIDAGAHDPTVWLETARALGLGTHASIEDALDLLLAESIASSTDRRLFITDFPPKLAALARVGPDGMAARFELAVEGIEVANGYGELCDPDELEARMDGDIRRRRAAGRPDVAADQRLLAAQRQGLPDCAGVAVGFDRLVALRLGASAVGEAMAFDWERA
ncbi:MAG: EF-P lysine aminoacylase GenX [Gammaproteobacteria bacterium]|nr:EF-P lysine aminoacylase GenX [Gammaproteobacteria bacterium]MYK48438.1 EF-P lysine aminoacylase GenX [Gammaproteobacteria bacterium]